MRIRPLPYIGLALLMMAPAVFAGDDNDKTAAPATPTVTDQTEVQRLKALLTEQQKQIEQLRKALAEQGKLLDSIADHLQASSEETAPAALPTHQGTGEIASTTPIVPPAPAPGPTASPFPNLPSSSATSSSSASTAIVPDPQQSEAPSPLQLKIGDATITPVGFMDLTNVWRSAGTGAGIGTNFGSVPFNNTVTGRLTEDRLSAQNSRVGIRVDANVKGANVLGYMEGDFLGFVPTNAAVTSNSMTFRMRLYWADVRKGKWEILGGQSWSMLTPNRKGISALPADLFYSQDMDTNYQLGLTWTRQAGFRFLLHPSDKVTFGISLEDPEQYIGGTGGSTSVVLPSALSASNYSNEVNNGGTTLSVPNLAPDIIAKLAFDPTSRVHVEVAGLESTFKTYYQASNTFFTKVGAGGSLNANLELLPGFRFVTNNFWSDGGGRYIYGQAPDFIVAANGAPLVEHAGSTVDGFEATLKNSLFYTYYGGVYIDRDTARDTNNSLIGWGYSGSSNAMNRAEQEITFGLTQTLWRDAKFGALSLISQYSYVWRNPWYVAINAPKNAHMDMFYIDLRYTLPGSAPTIKY